ncbi:MAG TPA: hypothetical protein VM557_07750 [Thermoanaerobaculia bacterium]|nr:hypothetical protein [Thermoanaerobaculia bacterium]
MSDALAATFERLREAIESMSDPFYQTQLRLAATVLGNSIETIRTDPSPANISDAEFAFGDITAIAGEIPTEDEERLNPLIDELRQGLASMKESKSLPPEVVQQVRQLQEQLKERRVALERQGFRFESEEAHIPNHPRELVLPARRLHRILAESGFTIRSLDKLVAEPDDFAYHDVSDLIADLDAATR